MSLKKLVPPIELCRKIPTGEFAESAMIWGEINGHEPQLYSSKAKLGKMFEVCPAPTLEEIIRKIRIDLLCGIEHHGNFYVANRHIGCCDDERAATAALRLWFQLKGI